MPKNKDSQLRLPSSAAQGIAGRVDLLKLLATGDQALPTLAELLGYERQPRKRQPTSFPSEPVPGDDDVADPPEEPEATPSERLTLKPSTFWQITRSIVQTPLPEWEPDQSQVVVTDTYTRTSLPHVALARPASLLTALRKQSTVYVPSNRVDSAALVDSVSRGELPRYIPRYQRRRWPRRLTVLIDRSRHLVPYWRDQSELLALVKHLYPNDAVTGLVCDEQVLPVPKDTDALVAYTDLGSLHETTRYLAERWQEFAMTLSRRGIPLVAIVPCRIQDVPLHVRAPWRLIPGDASVRSTTIDVDREQSIRRIVALLSLTVRLDWGMLRLVRRLLPETRSDPAIESLIAQSSFVESRHFNGGCWNRDQVRRLETQRLSEPLPLRKAVEQIRKMFREGMYPGIRYAETIGLEREINDGLISRDEWEQAAHWLTQRKGETEGAKRDWLLDVLTLLPEEAMHRSSLAGELHALFEDLRRDRPELSPLSTMVPKGIRTTGQIVNQLSIVQTAHTLSVTDSTTSSHNLLGVLATRNQELKISFYEKGAYTYPSWATRHGIDEFGHWAEFDLVVPNSEYERQMEELSSFRHPDLTPEYVEEYLKPGMAAPNITVTQRLRWIPPGKFLMGSPEHEEGRFDDEGPQHEEVIENGFWMFDTPVTQELWQAVMGENPSKFQGAKRPVERISWEMARDFIEHLNAQVEGLELRLPQEAEWEYACRAGTTGPHYHENLDQIAWYNENSDRETHPVKQKLANKHGLYDMLGNVFEWCEDEWRSNYDAEPHSTSRVIRGGSWYSYVRYVRSAVRVRSTLGSGNFYIGFRCVEFSGAPVRSSSARGVERAVGVSEGAADAAPQKENTDRQLRSGTSGAAWVAGGDVSRPDWSSDFGNDKFGYFADFNYESVVQRLRWIPPGKFLMGSPEDDPEGFDRERPQHTAVIESGFWMFDTPVTQAMWAAVMGDNPSHFQGAERPVERISWNQTHEFFQQVKQETGIILRLPQEAEWEYACRAGTTDPRYHDDIDQIAWYGENSGFETHPVKKKLPNQFGLYDMLGNVYEWCEDEWRSNYEAVLSDSTGRVIRGGSWSDDARSLRSAYGFRYAPGSRSHGIGFRCVEFESGAQSSQSGERAVDVSELSPQASGDRTPASGGAWLNLTTPGPHTIELPNVDVIQIQTDLEIVELERLPRPRWAKSMGRDRYGLWADVEVEGVTFKLRWIPPGRFLMGSPKTDEYRDNDEGPQHEELIPVGFWMFETPVTQELWEAVMRNNPSKFKSPQRPVEQVSWNECHEFITKLNARLEGLELTLPCEAQWEYACRAGTTTSTYAGELEIQGERNGPLLDEIAWYGGNCGVNFDLDEGQDTSGWDEKQYEFDIGGTRAVKQKQPNSFGLYDMLGNVYEWCGDHWRENYEAKPASTSRVIRGGSWVNLARYLRSAYRDGSTPEFRDDDIGFRCVEFKPELQPIQSRE